MGPSIAGLGSVGGNAWLAVLADASIKGVVVLTAAALICLAWRRAAAQRHLIWCMAVCGMLLLPLLSLGLPEWQVRMLPHWEGDAPLAHGDAPEVPADIDPMMRPDELEANRADALAARPRYGDDTTASQAVVDATAPRAGPNAETAEWVSASVVVTAIWMLGALTVLAPHAIGLLALRRLAARAQPLDDLHWSSLLESVSYELGLHRRVRLLAGAQTVMPMTWGVLRPTVLLPADADAWAEPWRRVVLLHELAHVKRFDIVTQGLARLACAVYWFHPLVWLAARALRRYREQACDDHVLAAGTPPSTYATRLLDLAGTLRTTALPSLASVPMARPSHLEGRLLAILCPHRSRKGVTRVAAAVTAALTFCAIIPLAAIRAGARAPTESVEPTITAQQQDSVGPRDQEETDPLPPGVVRVFGSERFRTWYFNYCLALSPDGKTAATGARNHVQLTDVASGKVIKVLETKSGPVWSVAFSPDGKRVALGTSIHEGIGAVEIWGLGESKRLVTIGGQSPRVSSVVFARGGADLITGELDGKIRIWNAETAELRREISAHAPADGGQTLGGVCLAVSRDEQYLLSGAADGIVKLWNLRTGGLMRTLESHRYVDLNRPADVNDVEFSPDGNLLASSGSGGALHVSEVESGRLVYTVRLDKRGVITRPRRIAFSPDGRYVALGVSWNFGAEIELRDAKTGALQGQLPRLSHYLWGLEFTPDGHSLVSAGYDSKVSVWDVNRMEQRHPSAHNSYVANVAFSADGNLLATVGFGDDTAIHLWDVASRRIARSFQLDPRQNTDDLWVDWDVVFSPDGTRLAVAGETIYVFRIDTGEREMTLSGSDTSSRVGFSPNGELLATIARGNVRVVNLSTRDEAFTMAGAPVVDDFAVYPQCIRLTQDGRVILCTDPGGAKSVRVATEEVLFARPSGDGFGTRAAASDDLLAVSYRSSTVRLYDATTGDELPSLDAQQDQIAVLTFSEDGRSLATADYSGNAVLWDLDTRAIQKTWKIGYGTVPIHDLGFSPDGRYLATANANGTAYLLEVPR